MNPTREQEMIAIREAAEWNQRLNDKDLDPALQLEYKRWLRLPFNAREMGRICLVDALLHRGSLTRELDDKAPQPTADIIDFERFAPATRPRVREQVTARAPRRLAIKAVAALAIAAGLVLTTFVVMMTGKRAATDQVIVTRVGKWDKQLLEDGSVVSVGPNTELRFHFDARLRSVAVLSGEALFEVAKDPSRPFVVATSAGSVRAVGTEFATAYRGDTVVVTVAEGRVAVAPQRRGGAVQPIIPLVANQQLVLRRSGADPPRTVDAGRELKWVRNWFEYDGERIREIIAELNRRHASQVIVDNPEVTRLRMNSLVFKPSEPEDFVAQINRWYLDSTLREASADAAGVALHLQPQPLP